jgi:hypothetical protein
MWRTPGRAIIYRTIELCKTFRSLQRWSTPSTLVFSV